MEIKDVVILSAMYSWIVWIELDLVIVEGSPVKMHAITKMASLIRVPNSVGAKVTFAFAMVFGETLCGRFLHKFWRKRTRLPCMGPTESLYTLSPVLLAKVSVAQAFWRKILHIFTTGVGELFSHFRQSFWRNHLLACTISLGESCWANNFSIGRSTMLTNATLINLSKNAEPKSSYSSNSQHLKVWANFTNVTTSKYFRQIHLCFFLLVSFSLKIESLNILSQWWNHRSWSKKEHVIRESYSAYTVREKRVKIYSTTVKLWPPFEWYSAHLVFPPLNWINHTKLANCEEHLLEKNLSADRQPSVARMSANRFSRVLLLPSPLSNIMVNVSNLLFNQLHLAHIVGH